MGTNTGFHAGSGGQRKGGSHGWKKKKSRRKGNPTPESFLEQPLLNQTSTVRCEICGLPVDPKRMHFHMVRFHGAARRSQGPAV